jgi:hypothetical protein
MVHIYCLKYHYHYLATYIMLLYTLAIGIWRQYNDYFPTLSFSLYSFIIMNAVIDCNSEIDTHWTAVFLILCHVCVYAFSFAYFYSTTDTIVGTAVQAGLSTLLFFTTTYIWEIPYNCFFEYNIVSSNMLFLLVNVVFVVISYWVQEAQAVRRTEEYNQIAISLPPPPFYYDEIGGSSYAF